LPDDGPAPEAPVPVDPDIIDNLNACLSANDYHNFDNVSQLKCVGFDYVSKLHNFIDGCNYNFNFVNSKDDVFSCKNVFLDSDFVKLSLAFVGNDINLDDSLARERLSCKFVHIFYINHSKNNFANGFDFYFNKYWGNISHVNVSSKLRVYASFYQTLYKFYFSGICSNIVSILARSWSFLSFDLDLHHCCLAV
jgi:hypothetical protein